MPGIETRIADGDKVGKKFALSVRKFSEKQRRAVAVTARKVADQIEFQGRQNIAQGGNFKSPRWQQGLQALVSFKGAGNAIIRVTHAVRYWKVFEFGARILGRPLLWIPLSFTHNLGRRARDYPGRLVRVDRPGRAPLLVDPKAGPQYFGKESVRIPRKWRLRDVIRRVHRRTAALYKEAMRNGQ